MDELIILSLITYYLVQLFVYEDGPMDVFFWFRWLFGVNVPVVDALSEEIIGYESNGRFTAYLVTCYVCSSFWISVIVCLISGDYALILAVSGASTLLHSIRQEND